MNKKVFYCLKSRLLIKLCCKGKLWKEKVDKKRFLFNIKEKWLYAKGKKNPIWRKKLTVQRRERRITRVMALSRKEGVNSHAQMEE